MSSIGKTRNTLYKTARILGDIQAVAEGRLLPVPQFRISNKCLSRGVVLLQKIVTGSAGELLSPVRSKLV